MYVFIISCFHVRIFYSIAYQLRFFFQPIVVGILYPRVYFESFFFQRKMCFAVQFVFLSLSFLAHQTVLYTAVESVCSSENNVFCLCALPIFLFSSQILTLSSFCCLLTRARGFDGFPRCGRRSERMKAWTSAARPASSTWDGSGSTNSCATL